MAKKKAKPDFSKPKNTREIQELLENTQNDAKIAHTARFAMNNYIFWHGPCSFKRKELYLHHFKQKKKGKDKI